MNHVTTTTANIKKFLEEERRVLLSVLFNKIIYFVCAGSLLLHGLFSGGVSRSSSRVVVLLTERLLLFCNVGSREQWLQ